MHRSLTAARCLSAFVTVSVVCRRVCAFKVCDGKGGEMAQCVKELAAKPEDQNPQSSCGGARGAVLCRACTEHTRTGTKYLHLRLLPPGNPNKALK